MSETELISGREPAAKIREEISAEVSAVKEKGIMPRMAVVLVADDPAVLSYVEVKKRLAEKLGIIFDLVPFPATVSQAELNQKLKDLSNDPSVHGIVLELPLSPNLDADEAILNIAPSKDIDGMTPTNIGLVLMGNEERALVAATAQACVLLAEKFGSLSGKRVAMVGKGRTVGKPLIPVLLNRHATLVVCHAETKDLEVAIQGSEIVIVGVGKPGLINANNVSAEQIIIDAGTTLVGERIMGDAAPEVQGIVRALTPVPDGVGPLTTAFIFKNLLKAIKLQQQ
jgi:methylenetetrahydrofolate dehydrogenase (NADP+) / methenyltetrahydrofolate cyclohydrolase